MQCPKCKTEVTGGAAFCSSCGAQLKEPEADQSDSGSADEPMQQMVSAGNPDSGEEKMLWEGGYSGKAMFGTWLLSLLITAGLIAGMVFLPLFQGMWVVGVIALIWIGSLLRLAYKKLSVKYELSNKKFMHRAGILVRRIDRIELFEIVDVTSNQGLIQRLFNVGTVKIVSKDQSHPELYLEGIVDPLHVADMIDDTSRPIREKRTLITS